MSKVSTWTWLDELPPAAVARYLSNEYPQIVAMILDQCEERFAGKVLENLPENFAAEVTMRLLRMENANPAALDIVAEVLHMDFLTHPRAMDPDHRDAKLATMIKAMNDGPRARHLAMLEERSREHYDAIKAKMEASHGE